MRSAIIILALSVACFAQGGGINVYGGKISFGGKIVLGGSGPPTCTAASGHNYTTLFPLTENPISECNSWINGGVTGLDWNNFLTTTNFAKGIEAAVHANDDDPTIIVQGAWGNDQEVWGTIVAPTGGTSNTDKEIELRLRTNISAHSITGYELQLTSFQTTTTLCSSGFIKWNGLINDFTPLSFTQFTSASAQCLHTGDIVRATFIGSNMEYFINGILAISGTDSTFASGSPGIGSFIASGAGLTIDFGYSAFGATDTPFRDNQVTALDTAVSGTTVAPAFPANTATGDMIWCMGYWADQARTATVSDAANGTYTANPSGPTNGAGALAAYRAQTFWKLNVTGATTPAITMTLSGSAGTVDRALGCHNVRGPSASDQSTAVKAGSGTAMTSNTTALTTAAHEYLTGGCVTGGVYSSPLPAPFTERNFTSFGSNVTADQIVVVTGTYQLAATSTNSNWLCSLDTFK